MWTAQGRNIHLTSQAYRSSGVNLDEMDTLKERIKAFASATHGPEVLNPEGGFAGLFRLSGFKQPVLVASTDGVGTKTKVAAQLGHYESIGQDLVTLNVNGGHRPVPMMRAESKMAGDAVSSVGPREIQATVSATFELD